MRDYANRERGKQDGALRIMDALSGVDPELLERSDHGKKEKAQGGSRKPLWRYGRAWAAVFCLAAVGIMTWGGYQYRERGQDAAGGAAPSHIDSVGIEQKDDALKYVEMQPSAAAAEENGGSAGAGEPGGQVSAGGAAPVERAESIGDPVGNPIENPVKNEVWGESSPEKGSATQGSFAGNEGSQVASSSSAPNHSPEKGEGTDGIYIDEACGLPPVSWQTLTEEDARGMMGSYVPDKLPEGYGFESARWATEERALGITWCRGMDYIHLSMRTPEETCRTVDIGIPETYDVRLYEVPYGETVPEEYREVFDNPVFAWEDMSLDIVESRMKVYEDRGDTATPRGNFSVLFPEGVLVRFTGRGSAEQIWEMFCSMGL